MQEQVAIRRRVGANKPINYVGITCVRTAANLSMPIPSRGTLRSLVKRRGDQAAVQPFDVLSLRQLVRAHQNVPDGEHSTFVVSTEDNIANDGTMATIALSTPAVLRNVAAARLVTAMNRSGHTPARDTVRDKLRLDPPLLPNCSPSVEFIVSRLPAVEPPYCGISSLMRLALSLLWVSIGSSMLRVCARSAAKVVTPCVLRTT